MRVGGAAAAIGAHTGIAMTTIWRFGNEQQKVKYLKPGIEGKKIAALGITEPDAGSDVSSITTRAVDKGEYYLLNGSKAFITNGVYADYVIVAAKTDDSPGHRNTSLFIVESDWEGFSVGKKLDKLGWRASDTGELYFENVRVPKENLIGKLNEGFKYIMINFQWERLTLALNSIALAEKALEDTVRYGKERIQFGGRSPNSRCSAIRWWTWPSTSKRRDILHIGQFIDMTKEMMCQQKRRWRKRMRPRWSTGYVIRLFKSTVEMAI